MSASADASDAPVERVPGWMTPLLAASCGFIAANLYYAQPLAGPIGASLGLSPGATGLVVTMTQIGYATGLLLIVPLGDLVENRRLILLTVALATAALAAVAVAPDAMTFLTASVFIGLGSVAIQIIVPYAAHFAADATRGRTVGNVMSGLMLGIMLARPVASFGAAVSSWRAVFGAAVVVMLLLATVLWWVLPRRSPAAGLRYGELLASMGDLVRKLPMLRRRAIYQACLFGAFSLFWTTTPLLLAGPLYHLSQGGIALFALAGGAGAIAAPIAGRVADRGWIRPASGIAMGLVVASFGLTHLASAGSLAGLALLVAAAILLDFGVTANLVLGQRELFALGAAYRARLNGMFLAFLFSGGALGSALGGWSYAEGGWPLASGIGAALPILALLHYAGEWRRPSA